MILLDTSGSVLCTNQRFADLLAQANGATVKPGSKWWTTEAWAPAGAIFSVLFILAFWGKYAPPARSRPTPVVVTPAPVRKPPPTPAAPATPAKTQPRR